MRIIVIAREEKYYSNNQMQFKMGASNDEDTLKDKALEGIGRPMTRSRTRKGK